MSILGWMFVGAIFLSCLGGLLEHYLKVDWKYIAPILGAAYIIWTILGIYMMGLILITFVGALF